MRKMRTTIPGQSIEDEGCHHCPSMHLFHLQFLLEKEYLIFYPYQLATHILICDEI